MKHYSIIALVILLACAITALVGLVTVFFTGCAIVGIVKFYEGYTDTTVQLPTLREATAKVEEVVKSKGSHIVTNDEGVEYDLNGSSEGMSEYGKGKVAMIIFIILVIAYTCVK